MPPAFKPWTRTTTPTCTPLSRVWSEYWSIGYNHQHAGCNFCPFAAREVRHNKIHYEVLTQPLRSMPLIEFMV